MLLDFVKSVPLFPHVRVLQNFFQHEDFFRERFWGYFCNMVNIFTCRYPNRSGVGAIDNPARFEQAFVQYYIPEDPEKIFTHDISIVHRQKMFILDV